MREKTVDEITPIQLTLFEDIEDEGLSIDEAAQQAGVSSATIRNWIKTGYLRREQKGFVSLESLNRFFTEVAGRDKLNSRANKSLKDNHDHTKLSLEFLQKASVNGCRTESLGSEYEASLSESYKNSEGIYYTPPSIINDLFRIRGEDISSEIFCDPCCGSGNFIMRALDLGFRPENIYGYDTDPVAVALTKNRIFEKAGYKSDNIKEADFLKISSDEKGLHFNYIYTNPPWGKKLPKKEKELYAFLFHAGRSIDTCSLFFFACLSCLKKDGKLGLLLPESFFNISIFENARIKSLDLSINRLIDYGKPFKGLVTKAQAIVLTNKEDDNKLEPISCQAGGREFTRPASSFSKNPRCILNFHCDMNDSEIIRHVFSIPHITLNGRVKWGLGIVTGNNKKFCKNEHAEGHIPVYKGSDIKLTGLKDPSCFIPKELSLYQQVAPVDLFQATEKLIYKFISSDLCFFHDTEQRYILNSANMLMPADGFPISGSQLCSILNSGFMNWLFKNIFNTHKILRGDLELLPIHVDYFMKAPEFNEKSYLDFLNIERAKNGAYRIKR